MTDLSPASAVPGTTEETLPSAAIAVRHDTPLTMAAGALWVRELRARMRGKKAFIFITFYLAIMVGLLWLALRGVDDGFVGALEQMSIGRWIFAGVVLVETLVIVALAPAYTAGSISQEREKQTFDLLAITPVSSLSIVIGKLLSGLSYLALLAGLSLPVASLAFIYGGVDPGSIVLAYLILAVSGVALGSIGIACSAAFRRTQAATVAAFMLTGLIVVGATIGWVAYRGIAAERKLDPPPEALLWVNPFLAESDLLCATGGTVCAWGITVGVDEVQNGEWMPAQQQAELSGGFWPKSVLSMLAITALALFIATQAISPTRRWRPGAGQLAPPPEPAP